MKVRVDYMVIIFPIGIAMSVVLYIYYKVMILKTGDELTQLYYNAKAKTFLGVFILFFGITMYIYYQTKFVLFVSIIFAVLGIMQLIRGLRETKHYKNEWKRLKSSD